MISGYTYWLRLSATIHCHDSVYSCETVIIVTALPVVNEIDHSQEAHLNTAVATPSAVMMTPAILRTREIDPLWMSELVAHEVEMSLPTSTKIDTSSERIQFLA